MTTTYRRAITIPPFARTPTVAEAARVPTVKGPPCCIKDNALKPCAGHGRFWGGMFRAH